MTPADRLTRRVRRVAGVPIVAARIWLRSGSRLEETPGQSLITGRLLGEGTRRRTWDQVTTQAEDRGVLIETFGSQESLCVSIEALAGDWEIALAWLAELTLEPRFPADRLEWVRRQALAELESLLDQPETRPGHAFLRQIYHPHPYGRPYLGDAPSLASLQREDCVAYHQRALEWGGTVVVTGMIDEAAVERRLTELFADLSGPAAPLPEVAPPRGLGEPRIEVTAGETDQAHLFAGHLTLARNHPDLPAMQLAGVVLGVGSGMSGRLPERIREREALAYFSDVSLVAGFDAGHLVSYAGTAPATLAKAEVAMREELGRLVEEGIREDELEDARAYLIGRDPFRRETARQWANLLAEAEIYGLPIDRPEWVIETLESTTLADVEAAARRWIRPDQLQVTVGLPGQRETS